MFRKIQVYSHGHWRICPKQSQLGLAHFPGHPVAVSSPVSSERKELSQLLMFIASPPFIHHHHYHRLFCLKLVSSKVSMGKPLHKASSPSWRRCHWGRSQVAMPKRCWSDRIMWPALQGHWNLLSDTQSTQCDLQLKKTHRNIWLLAG